MGSMTTLFKREILPIDDTQGKKRGGIGRSVIYYETVGKQYAISKKWNSCD